MTKKTIECLVSWLQERVAEAGASGLILGISGGVDSAVAAALASRAYPESSLGLIMPCHSSKTDVADAVSLVQKIQMRYHIIYLDGLYDEFMKMMRVYPEQALNSIQERMVFANIKPRLRMMTLYYMAGLMNYLVLGTSNKSEITVGYATKWGDNAVDLQVLGDLYKSEVYSLARDLQVPREIITKPPSAGLWEGQTDEGEMGFSYEELEIYLRTGQGDEDVISRIQQMNRQSQHKRQVPPVPCMDAIRSS